MQAPVLTRSQVVVGGSLNYNGSKDDQKIYSYASQQIIRKLQDN